MTIAQQAPLSLGFLRQEYWRRLPFPTPWDLPNPGIRPMSPALAGGFFTTEPPGKTQKWFLWFYFLYTINVLVAYSQPCPKMTWVGWCISVPTPHCNRVSTTESAIWDHVHILKKHLMYLCSFRVSIMSGNYCINNFLLVKRRLEKN